jgi:dUTP pyrophosphatase
MNKLKVKLLYDSAIIPAKAHDSDAAYDLFSRESMRINMDETRAVSTGISIGLPEGTYGQIAPRSGLALKRSIFVNGGVIDRGYTGEIKVILHNMGEHPFEIKPGDKIAQLLVKELRYTEIEIVSDLEITDRAESGFGSTG